MTSSPRRSLPEGPRAPRGAVFPVVALTAAVVILAWALWPEPESRETSSTPPRKEPLRHASLRPAAADASSPQDPETTDPRPVEPDPSAVEARAAALLPDRPPTAPAEEPSMPELPSEPLEYPAATGPAESQAPEEPGAPQAPQPPEPPDDPAEPDEVDEADAADELVWTVDKDGIQAAMRESRPKLRECYAAWLKENEALGGRMVVRFTISPGEGGEAERGRVTRVEIPDSELDHGLLEGCVLNVLAGLSWSAPDEPLTVSYPFVFAGSAQSEE